MNHISEYEDKALEKLKAAWLEAKDDERVLILAFAQGIVAGAKKHKIRSDRAKGGPRT